MAARSSRDRADREARRRAQAYAVGRAVHETRQRRRRRDDVLAAIVFAVVAVVAILAQVGYVTVGPGTPAPSRSTAPSPSPTSTATVPPKSLSEDRTWTGELTLNSTKLRFTLDGKKAPQAVANFVSLAKGGFYADTQCFRLTTYDSLKVLQCGSPDDTATGGPGYSFGPLENVPAPTVTRAGTKYGVYDSGVIAMARGSAEDSQGSQFFIVYGKSELPQPGYTVFGRVTGGLGALRTAVTDQGTKDGTEDGAPKVVATVRGLTVE